MRILVTYGQRPPYSLFGLHLVDAFRALGHSAMLLPVRDRPWWGGWAKRLPQPWKTRWQWHPVQWANAKLLEVARSYRPEIVLEIDCGGELLQASTLRVLAQRYATRFALWLVEGPFGNEVPSTVADYDLVVSTSQAAVEQLQQAGFHQARYLPFATEPRIFHPSLRGARPYALGFVGAYSPKRVRFLEAVSDLNLHILGTDWETAAAPEIQRTIHTARGAFGRATVRCYQTTAIHINIQREHMTRLTPSGERIATGLNLRHFDIPACGALCLTEWVQELPEAFTVGEEVETFHTPEELRAKSHYLLSHEAQVQTMTQRALARVLEHHTWHHRARQWLAWFADARGQPRVAV